MMYLVLTRWQCPKKKCAQEGNHYETPGWSQSACITLLAFRLLSWYMGARAPFRALSLVWWEDSYFTSSKYFPLVTCKTVYRHVWLPFNILVCINIYWQKALCTQCLLVQGKKKNLLRRIFWVDTQLYYHNSSFPTDIFCQRGSFC